MQALTDNHMQASTSEACTKEKIMHDLSQKTLQEKLILSLVKDHEPISRIEIKKITDIRLATITEITKELIDGGVIKETGDDPENTNKRKKLLYINKDRFYVVGVEISPDRIFVLLTNLKGEILQTKEKQIGYDYPYQQIMDILTGLLKEMISGYRRENLLGIGLSNPGRVDKKKGESAFSSQLEKWNNVPLETILKNEFGLPVYIGNNSETGIFAESWFGEAKNVRDAIYLHAGAGIAIYIKSNGNFIKGYSGVAGEIGHNIVVANGELCTCGNYGCLQTVASSKVLVRKVVNILNRGASSVIEELTGGDYSKVSIDTIIEAAKKNDKIALSILDDAGEYIGIAVSNAVNLLGPQMIILGGEILKNNTYILNTIRRALQRNVLPVIYKDIVFKTSSFPENESALGAIAMVLDDFYMYSKLKDYDLLE